MNVFKKISSSTIFATEKKRNPTKIPQSAQKLAAKQQDCYYLIDYEARGDGILICKLARNKTIMKTIGWKKTKNDIKECTVKVGLRDLWIGKRYWFVDMKAWMTEHGESIKQTTEKFMAERMILVEDEENRRTSRRK